MPTRDTAEALPSPPFHDGLSLDDWGRLPTGSADEVNFFIHAYYLHQFISSGMKVLNIGSRGGGIVGMMTEVGCRVVVVEFTGDPPSDRQGIPSDNLTEKAEGPGPPPEGLDLSQVDAESFDAVVCYGGLPWPAQRTSPSTLGECFRVCKPGGHLLISVLSLWGASRQYLDGPGPSVPTGFAPNTRGRVSFAGSWTEAVKESRMFKATELKVLAQEVGLDVAFLSASNALSIGWGDLFPDASADPDRWKELLLLELAACREEACLDMGARIILVGHKPI